MFRQRSCFTRFLLLMAILCMAIPSFAQNFTFEYEGQTLNYTILDEDAKTCEVAKNSGVSGDLKIPTTVSNGTNEYTVVSIGEDAFYDCSALTGSLVIPNSVTKIGSRAFYNCRGFNGTLTIGESVEIIEEFAFEYCGFTGELRIPKSVEEIGVSAFAECRNFSGSLILGESVKIIGQQAFVSCTNLGGVLVLPSSLETIGAFPFAGLRIDDATSTSSKFTIVISLRPLPIESTESYIFSADNLKATLYVPDEQSVEEYKKSDEWKGFKSIKPINEFTIPATKIEVSPTTVDLIATRTVEIKPTITPLDVTDIFPDNTIDKTVNWSSSDESVATVDASGMVTAVKEGLATITAATPNNLTATCEVTVKPLVVEAEGVTLDKTTLNLTEGETATLSATVSPENTTDKTVTWTSSDATVASVNTGGVVTGLKAGTATITVSTINGLTATCDVTVKAATVEASGLTLNLEETELVNGKTVQLQATVIPGHATDKNVTWTSSDATVASVNASGLVTALKSGKATITASTANGLKATCEVTVVAATVDASGLELNLEEAEIVEGESVQLQATVLPADATDKTVTWTSSDAAVATVNASGLVTALKPGQATITATSANGLKAICEVTVVVATVGASGLELNLEEAEIVEGESVQLQATVLPADATDKTVTWTSSDATVAMVNASGLVTALKPGKATITASSANGLKAICEVTVVVATVGASGLELNLEEAEIVEGESVQLQATVLPADATDKSVAWTSSNETVATVNASGMVAALKAGTATITAATANGLTATCTVTVTAKLSGIEGVDGDGVPAVSIEGGEIVISGDGVAEIYSLTGSRVAVANGGRISGLPRGIYLVRLAGKTYKIAL